jgi:predicted acylesterase/phospholipase RssA
MRRLGATLTLAILLLGVAGCAAFHYPVNTRLAPEAPAGGGYRFPRPPAFGAPADRRDELFVCVALSGGGTRAAAFAYGVLQALAEARIGHNGLGSLLDEVDCLSGISGGAFAAAAYVQLGQAEFFKQFPPRFLDRNVQGGLVRTTLNPVNFVRLMSPYLSRIDLAAELYDRLVFEDRTFATLDPTRRPFLLLNATNMANGAGFEFTQDEFDFLGSDLGSVRIARAVAASSAFPFLLSPITVWSYPERLSEAMRLVVTRALEDRETNVFRYAWARSRQDLTTTGEKYIHLLDGGLADNIGARAIVNAFARESGFVRVRMNNDQIKRFVVIMVNAKTSPPEELTRSPQGPGIVSVAMTTATAPMDNFSADTVELMQRLVTDDEKAQRTLDACNAKVAECTAPRPEPFAPTPAVRGCVVELSFEGLPPAERDELLSYPTSFSLTAEQVKKLIDAGRALVARSADLQRLLGVLRREPGVGQGIAGVQDRCA